MDGSFPVGPLADFTFFAVGQTSKYIGAPIYIRVLFWYIRRPFDCMVTCNQWSSNVRTVAGRETIKSQNRDQYLSDTSEYLTSVRAMTTGKHAVALCCRGTQN